MKLVDDASDPKEKEEEKRMRRMRIWTFAVGARWVICRLCEEKIEVAMKWTPFGEKRRKLELTQPGRWNV
jgi:hypothetical protein